MAAVIWTENLLSRNLPMSPQSWVKEESKIFHIFMPFKEGKRGTNVHLHRCTHTHSLITHLEDCLPAELRAFDFIKHWEAFLAREDSVIGAMKPLAGCCQDVWGSSRR